MPTREEIIAAAKECGMHVGSSDSPETALFWYPEVERFANHFYEAGRKSVDTHIAIAEAYRCGEEAGRKAENDACEQVCEDQACGGSAFNSAVKHIGSLIKARRAK